MVNFCKSYYIKDLRNKQFIPTDNSTYNNTEWFTSIIETLPRYIVKMFSKRELIIEDFLIFENIEKWKNGTFLDDVLLDDITDSIDILFLTKQRAYEMMFKALNEEYNPIWNVDGTESIEYTKTNTGTQDIDMTRSGNMTDNVAFVGSEKDSNTVLGTKTNETSYTGMESNERTGDESHGRATMDSVGCLDDTNTTYNSVTDSLEFTNRKDTTTEQFSNDYSNDVTKTYTNRADNRTVTYNNMKEEQDRTDDLEEHYEETKTRGGNIGVTKSQELVESELELRQGLTFLEIVGRDIANLISIAIY